MDEFKKHQAAIESLYRLLKDRERDFLRHERMIDAFRDEISRVTRMDQDEGISTYLRRLKFIENDEFKVLVGIRKSDLPHVFAEFLREFYSTVSHERSRIN